jgi:hypothetical protein
MTATDRCLARRGQGGKYLSLRRSIAAVVDVGEQSTVKPRTPCLACSGTGEAPCERTGR